MEVVKRPNLAVCSVLCFVLAALGITRVFIRDDDSIILSDTRNNCLRHISADGSTVKSLGMGVLLRPKGVCEIADGLLVCDSGHNRIRCFHNDGTMSAFAGSGRKGWRDGPLDIAQFNNPASVLLPHILLLLLISCVDMCGWRWAVCCSRSEEPLREAYIIT